MTRFGHFDDERARVRHHAPGHAAALDQLPRERGLLRSRLEHRGWVLLLPRCAAPTADALSVQQRPRPTPAGATSTCATADGDFWSPAWQPVQREPRRVTECRHGLGYTRSSVQRSGHRVEELFFVPARRDAARSGRRGSRTRARAASLSALYVVEFCLWDAWDDQTNYQRNLSTGEVEVDGRRRSITRRSTGSAGTTSRSSPDRERSQASTPSARLPRPLQRLGSAGGRRATGRSANSVAQRLVADRVAPLELDVAPGETERRRVRPRIHGEPEG